MKIYSGDEKTPTTGLSKSYAVDFKGKIVTKFILWFRQLSGSIGRFLHLAASDNAPDAASKSTVIKPYHALKTGAIPSYVGATASIARLEFYAQP
jgi:hypothetical protein